MSNEIFILHRGTTALLVSLPHVGTVIPDDIAARLRPHALAVPDTDWHLERLYAFARDELGASVLVPRFSRYCIDLNRPPENTPMYCLPLCSYVNTLPMIPEGVLNLKSSLLMSFASTHFR